MDNGYKICPFISSGSFCGCIRDECMMWDIKSECCYILQMFYNWDD